MHDRATPLDQFLDATAARQPTPGGGSVAALAGALSAAIGQMVLSYSVNKKDLLPFKPDLEHAIQKFEQSREIMLRLMAEDQEAYDELTAARKLPDDTTDKAAKLIKSISACIRGPQAVGATAVAILNLCNSVVEIVNPWLLSDLAVSADLAMATARCAIYNVRVNLSSVENETERARLGTETDEILSHALRLIQDVSPKIWSRYEQANRQ